MIETQVFTCHLRDYNGRGNRTMNLMHQIPMPYRLATRKYLFRL